MKKKLMSLLQYLLFLGLGVFLIWWSLRKVSDKDWTDIRQAFANANYWYLIPIVIALLASHYSRAMRWKILMEPMGYKTRISNTYLAVLIGYLANLAIPRLGEVLKCTLLARYEKVPADKLVGTIVAERAFDLLCLITLMIITFATQSDIIGEYFGGLLQDNFRSGKSSGKLFLILGILLVAGIAFFLVLKKLSHLSFVKKINKIIAGVWQGLTSVRYVKHKGWFFFHTAFIWVMYLFSVQMGMWAMTETADFGLKPSMSCLASGSIAMIVTPSGIGAYPIFIQGTMGIYGLKPSIALAFGWLMWAVQFFQILIAGFIALALLPYFNGKKKAAGAPVSD